MKLPDFYSFGPLNSLKERMGLPREALGTLDVHIDAGRLTASELERLTSQDGLDIALDDLRVLDDGTLAYKDSRVLLYIRDVNVMGDREPEPRYHLANCSTLRQMRERKRFNRYVVSTRLDGVFNLNISRGQSSTRRLVPLSVCQNCLEFLNFDGFRIEWARDRRIRAVRGFSLDGFFSKYPKSLHHEEPRYNSDNAPLNNYTANFSDISDRMKAAARYRCEACDFDCSAKGLKKFLHTHHIDGDKSNNSPLNLKVLCLDCHAKEHHHMRALPDFREFQSIKRGCVRPTGHEASLGGF
jgi:hypothetical protein